MRGACTPRGSMVPRSAPLPSCRLPRGLVSGEPTDCVNRDWPLLSLMSSPIRRRA